MKKVIPYFLLLVPLFTSGCFSVGANSGGDWGMSKPTAGQRVKAATADVLTLPIQVPYFAVAGTHELIRGNQTESWGDKQKQLAAELEKSPRAALQERWDLKGGEYECAFDDSFTNPNVKYTDELLEEIYQDCPAVKDTVFRCKYCSEDFLTRHFDEEYVKSVRGGHYFGLKNIINNPNTPLELVEKVALSNDRSPIVIESAKKIVQQRNIELFPNSKQK